MEKTVDPEDTVAPAEPREPVDDRATTADPRKPRRWRWRLAEVLISVASALILTAGGLAIHVDPIDRVGQVSGLAAIQFQFAIFGILLVAGLLAAHRWYPASRPYLARIGCAAVAGMVSGAVASGVLVALQDTPYGLWAGRGDYDLIFQVLRDQKEGKAVSYTYPPLFPYFIAAYTMVVGTKLAYALKLMQILGTAMFGPAAYVAWRLVLKPGWALAIGVVATLPLYDQVKPYRNIVLMVLVPVLLAFFRKVRRAEGLSVRDCVKAGIAYGAGFALLFLTYSGWFVWFAPGVVAAVLLLAPWRQGLRQVLWLLGVTGFTFVVVSWIHLGDLLGAGGAVSDSFMYFDTNTEPAYIAMWRDDRALDLNDMPWPPPAELGNVGLFTVLLVIGLAVALWLGWRRTPVIVLVCGIAGAWVIRMYLASRMYDTQLVRLYPRTTTILLYMLLVLTGLGVMYAFGRGAEFLRDSGRRPGVAVPVALLLVPLMLFFASASSATANRLMPDPRVHAYGWFSWIAHTTSLYDGTCPKYGILHGGCDQPLDLTNRLR